MPKMIFVNLPVADLRRATAFYESIGAVKNDQFSDATASGMVFSETIHAMLLTHDKFRQFTPKAIADARTTSEVLICISADSREDVDAMVEKAAPAGGKRRSRPEAGLRLHVWPQLRGSGRPYLGSDVDGRRGALPPATNRPRLSYRAARRRRPGASCCHPFLGSLRTPDRPHGEKP